MDAASGRPLAWLPAGLTSLILSLERTDSLALQFKAFSVSHAVKALLSVKNSSSPKDHLWGVPFHHSALRELAKPLDTAGLYSSPNPCSCEEFCECECEEEFEEFAEQELQYQWGFPLAGSLILNAPGSYPPNACFQARRDSRLPGFGSTRVQGFSLERRAPVEEKEFVDSAQDSKDSCSISVTPRQNLGGEEVAQSAEISLPKKEVEVSLPKKEVEVSLPSIGRGSEAKQTDGESQQDEISERIGIDYGVKDTVTSSRGPKWNFRMGQNAGAGALAGGVVSLCLHPIDTLKTIVQAQTGGSRNLLPILSSVISERGLKGLYRGLGSNLTSSAPISAIYTLTYEAVKAGLLRHIPEDMSAFAHCAAGGCASVATSIVYTPSECVKQQMQVNGLYQNSWKAFTSILKQGGLPMLYKGWGAVLCRNVPQSVIKFYTYEGLKLWAQGGQPRDTPLTTLQALAIGGVAGSTAAFFTTPFDVVKTRLQTQIPGSVQQYNGVIHAFQSIATTEGVAGLYRGLVPRLVIYVTQGALFFASYEFIKHVLSVEVPRLRIKTSPMAGYQRQPAPIPAEST